jgi:hypothetical protein
MVNPVSLMELSVQRTRTMAADLSAAAEMFEGAGGGESLRLNGVATIALSCVIVAVRCQG